MPSCHNIIDVPLCVLADYTTVRKRWRRDRDAAMGLQPQPEPSAALCVSAHLPNSTQNFKNTAELSNYRSVFERSVHVMFENLDG